MLIAALWCASKGINVLPLHYPHHGACSCGATVCDNAAKHPIARLVPHGLSQATTDPDTIRRWWTVEPYANIGGRTGEIFDLLDVDGARGAANLQELITRLGGMPTFLGVARSGRPEGGMHTYTVPGGHKALHGGKTSPPGIDVKGRGGYAVLPPSLHISGRRYEWVNNHFDTGEINGTVDWDTFYNALVVKPKHPPRAPRPTTKIAPDAANAYGRAVLARAVNLISSSIPGNRWQTLATEAIPLVARGIDGGCIDRDGGIRELEDAARGIGLGEREIHRITGLVDNMVEAGITHPIKPTQTATLELPTVAYETEDEAREDPWEPPWPLRYPTPPFPVETMGWMATAVNQLATQLQVPVDLIAMMTLATVAATVRGRIRVEIIPGWEEPLNLYVAVALNPGETKSPALSRITAPLRRKEKQARDQIADVITDQQFKKLFAEERAKKLRDKALKDTSDNYDTLANRDIAQRAAKDAENIIVPVMPRWLAGGDMTPEALVMKMAEQGGALAHLSAEGELFDTIVGGRYSNGSPHLSALLTAHDGREPILVHRKTAEDVEVPQPCLTLGLAIQPQVLQQLGSVDAAMRRGLGARFLYSIPRSLVGHRDMTLPRGSEDIEDFQTLIDGVDALSSGMRILRIPTRLPVVGGPGFEDIEAPARRGSEDFEATIRGYDKPESRLGGGGFEDIEDSGYIKVFFDSSSLSLLLHYRETLEPRRAAGTGDLGEIGGWANKLDGHLARLAALIQLVYDADPATPDTNSDTPNPGSLPQNPQNPPRIVSAEATSAALILGDYLIAHAVEAHAIMTGATEDNTPAAQLRGWLKERQLSEFTVRDAQQSLRRRATFREPEAVYAACSTLERFGWLRRLPPEPGPGRPSIRYLVHPEVHHHES